MPIFCENDTDIPVDIPDISQIAHFCLEFLHIPEIVELHITMISEADIAELHEKWLDLPGPTDVMSFPVDEITPGSSLADYVETPVLGDIVISPAFAQRQAEAVERTLEYELRILTVHGILHLTGYDHYEPQERVEMFSLQDTILEKYHAMQLSGEISGQEQHIPLL